MVVHLVYLILAQMPLDMLLELVQLQLLYQQTKTIEIQAMEKLLLVQTVLLSPLLQRNQLQLLSMRNHIMKL